MAVGTGYADVIGAPFGAEYTPRVHELALHSFWITPFKYSNIPPVFHIRFQAK